MLPKLPYSDNIRKTQAVTFSGINRNPAAPDGSVFWTQNMGSDRMPCLSPRKPRWLIGQFDDCHGVFAYNGLYMVRGTTIYKDGEVIGEALEESDKQFAHFNDAVTLEDYVLMYPDKVIIGNVPKRNTSWKTGLYVVAVNVRITKDPDMNYRVIQCNDVDFRELGFAPGEEMTISGSQYSANNKSIAPIYVGQHSMAFRPESLHMAESDTITLYRPLDGELRFTHVGAMFAKTHDDALDLDVTEIVGHSSMDWAGMGISFGDDIRISGSSIAGNNGTATVMGISDNILKLPYDRFSEATGETLVIEKVWTAPDVSIVHPLAYSVSGAAVVFEDGTLYGEPAENNTIKRTDGVWTGLNPGDTITIECTSHTENNGTVTIREVDGYYLRFYEDTFAYTGSDTISIVRDVPDLDGFFVHEQRVWGYKGSMIYVSKWNDPSNFNTYDQLTSDAWTYPMDGSGDIIGGIVYQGYPTFFKQDKVVRIYGDRPSQFRVMDVSTMGLHPGCGKSLAIAGDTLFYVSRNGLTAYKGGYGENIHSPFGDLRFTEAVAATDGRRYFLSAFDGEEWSIWTYDTNWDAWFREDAEHIIHSAYDKGNLYFVFENLQQHRYMWLEGHAVSVPEYAQQEIVYSEVEFGDFTGNYWTAGRGYGNPSRKGTSKIQLRVTLNNAVLTVYIAYDGGEKRKVKSIETQGKRSYYLPLIPKRSDHYRIYLEGAGDWVLNSLVREEYSGSDIH